MKTYLLKHFLGLFVILFVSTACKKDDSPTNSNSGTTEPLKILPLGDSRVEDGDESSYSYRYDLWKNLIDEGYTFDFIGPEKDPETYASYNNQEFDKDHAGSGGAKTNDIISWLNSEILVDGNPVPDIVLLGIGGNDLNDEADPVTVLTNINTIIDLIQAKNSDVTIFVEQIAGAMPSLMSTELTLALQGFNTEIANLATAQTTETSKVIAVNMSSILNDSDYSDEVHYNESGGKKVADQYFEAILANIAK